MTPPDSRFRPSGAALWIYAALLAGLGLSIGLSLASAGELRVVLHFAVALLMAALIIVVYMGLHSAGTLIRWFALGAVLWLTFLLVITPVDYLTR